MKKFDVVVIGSGLGGLLSACMLSKEGYNVCVVEKHHQIGGCLQTFRREGAVFDTGIHYIGSMDEHQILNRYFKYFGLTDKLNLQKLDAGGYDTIRFGNSSKAYNLAMGEGAFVESLTNDFPSEAAAIKTYMGMLNEVTGSLDLLNLRETSLSSYVGSKYLEMNASEYIGSLTENTRLRNVLAGNNSIYAGDGKKTSLYMHALIQKSFVNSAYRFVDGSDQLAYLLAELIKSNGGTVLTRHEVTKLSCSDDKVTCVEFAKGESIEADHFISNVHPSVTLGMVDSDRIKKVYRNRIRNLENTISSFIVYAVLKENSFPYINSNIYYHRNEDVWNSIHYTGEEWPKAFMFLTPASSKSQTFADTMTVLTYMKYSEVEKWANTTIERRGEEYKEFKRQKAERILDEVERLYPDIRASIKSYYTSSPLTYRDYTGTVNGSLYGIVRDCNSPLESYIHPKTKLKNLLFTGQNTNIHGALGVTIGAVLTCGEIVGINHLVRKIYNAQ